MPATRAGKLDALNEAFRQAEQHLYAANIGVEAEVEILAEDELETGDDGQKWATGERSVTSLVWGKWSGKWRLYIKVVCNIDPDDEECMGIEQAPVHVRLLAAKSLSGLESALHSKASEQLSEIDDAIAQVVAFTRKPLT